MNKDSVKQLDDILGVMRQRIELEDDDFHYEAVLDAKDKIQAVTDIKIGLEMLSVLRSQMTSNPGAWGR